MIVALFEKRETIKIKIKIDILIKYSVKYII